MTTTQRTRTRLMCIKHRYQMAEHMAFDSPAPGQVCYFSLLCAAEGSTRVNLSWGIMSFGWKAAGGPVGCSKLVSCFFTLLLLLLHKPPLPVFNVLPIDG